MMKIKTHRLVALAGLMALAACDQTGTDPLFDGVTPEEMLELAVLEDVGTQDITVELTTASNDVAADMGYASVNEGRGLNAEADGRFAAARDAMRAGDHRRALDEAREARRLIARAILATGGADAVVALVERIEDLAITSPEDDDVFDDPEAVSSELDALASSARDRLAAGDVLGAAERAILAEQRALHRRGRRDHRGDVHPYRARLAVALAGTAVSLAERLIDANDFPVRDAAVTDVADRQNRWLAHAKRLLERAERALASGHFARAVHFAQHAHWSALKAVILPGGITEEELRAMDELANRLYVEACPVIVDDPAVVVDDRTELVDDPAVLQHRLCVRAGRLIELGEKMLENGMKRGVAPLWRAAVISAWLIG